MTTHTDLLRLALDALTYRGDYRNKDRHAKKQAAISALRSALDAAPSTRPYELGFSALVEEVEATTHPQILAKAREWAKKHAPSVSAEMLASLQRHMPEDIAKVLYDNLESLYIEDDAEQQTPAQVVPAAPAAPSVPVGWKLVPVEPTPEMLDPRTPFIGGTFPFGDSTAEYISTGRRASWAAMLAAAPSHATGAPQAAQEPAPAEAQANGATYRKMWRAASDECMTLLAANAELTQRLRMAQKPARVALTLDYIEQHIGLDEGDREAVVALVREVERAHGIPGTDGAEHG